jgi:putative methylase
MGSKRALARRLASVEDFADPIPDLEQYPTPGEVAAHLVHLADLQGDLEGRTVIDLGSGTGMLALATTFRGAGTVLGVEIDPDALAVAAANERRVDVPTSVEWVRADATNPPFRVTDATILMNPPFGAQHGNEHADRGFLETAVELSTVSYSIHNAGSRDFMESFVTDHGGTVTHAFAVTLDVDRRFPFHDEATRALPAEAYRIEWS